MSVSSSLLVGGEDLVGLNLAWPSLLACSSKSTIINLVSDVLSLSADQGSTFEMRCGVANSPGCPVVVVSEALSTFAALDLRRWDSATARVLIVIGLLPMFQQRPGHAASALVE